jgi:hypothetical protein
VARVANGRGGERRMGRAIQVVDSDQELAPAKSGVGSRWSDPGEALRSGRDVTPDLG